MINFIFDIETLGKKEDAVVLSLACVPFKFEMTCTYEFLLRIGFYVKFSVEEQIKIYKNSIDQDVIDWWKKQSEIAKKVLTPAKEDVKLIDGLTALSIFLKNNLYNNDCFCWSRGNAFDFPKIESLHKKTGVKYPLNYTKYRDVRTFIDIMAGDVNGKSNCPVPNNFIAHNSLHDCAYGALSMIYEFNNFQA